MLVCVDPTRQLKRKKEGRHAQTFIRHGRAMPFALPATGHLLLFIARKKLYVQI
jgi:hypothetical protein